MRVEISGVTLVSYKDLSRALFPVLCEDTAGRTLLIHHSNSTSQASEMRNAAWVLSDSVCCISLNLLRHHLTSSQQSVAPSMTGPYTCKPPPKWNIPELAVHATFSTDAHGFIRTSGSSKGVHETECTSKSPKQPE